MTHRERPKSGLHWELSPVIKSFVCRPLKLVFSDQFVLCLSKVPTCQWPTTVKLELQFKSITGCHSATRINNNKSNQAVAQLTGLKGTSIITDTDNSSYSPSGRNGALFVEYIRHYDCGSIFVIVDCFLPYSYSITNINTIIFLIYHCFFFLNWNCQFAIAKSLLYLNFSIEH